MVEQFENIIFEWTNQLAVIRHGKTAAVFDSETINREQLYSVLIKDLKSGKSTGIQEIDLEEEKEDLPVLQFEDVGTNVLTDFNLEVEPGEVVKVYYMDDESCEQIIDLLKGGKKPSSGKITLARQEYRVNNIYQAVDKGVCFVEESPYQNMLFYNLNVRDNLCLALSKKVPLFWFRKRFVKSVDQLVKSVNIEEIARVRLRKLEPRILQQIAYYKWFLYAPKVVVCIKPFTETDIHMQKITVEMIGNLKSRGISVIILTSNFSELYRVEGDTIYIKNGRIIDEDEVYQTLYKK
jgi:ABC-type sugar transport system ATPase subunit